MTQDKDVQEWLDECRTQSTRDLYVYGSGLFFKWLEKEKGLSIRDFKGLSTKEMKHYVLLFQNSEPMGEGRVYTSKRKRGNLVRKPKPLSKNAINSVLTAMQSFCMFLEKPLLLKGKRVRLMMDTDSHIFSNGDLAAMFEVSDTKGKAILATGASLGWEVRSFLALDRKLVENLLKKAREEKQQFIYFEATRPKTGQKRFAILNPLAIEWLTKWLEQNPTNSLFDMTVSGITKFMGRTAKKANLTTTGRVRFHNIRKWVMSGLSRAGFNDFEIKYVLGKSIELTNLTYLQNLKETIMEKYPGAYEAYLCILKTPQELAKTRAHMAEIQRENEDFKERIDAMEKTVQSLTASLAPFRALPKELLKKFIVTEPIIEEKTGESEKET
jgi:hypothetical protein